MARKTTRRRTTRKTRSYSRKTTTRSRAASSSRSRRSAPRRTAKRVSKRASSPREIRLVIEQPGAAVPSSSEAIAQALANIAAGRAGSSKPQKARF